MSRSDHALGWEVWFLLALVGGGGGGSLFLISSVVLGVQGSNSGHAATFGDEPVTLTADRVTTGFVIAAMFVALAIWSMRSMRGLDRRAPE